VATNTDDDGLIPSTVIGDVLDSDVSGDEGNQACVISVAFSEPVVLDGADLADVLDTPNSEGEIRVTIGGVAQVLSDGTDDTFQFDNELLSSGGTLEAAILPTTDDGSVRVELYVNGELLRVTV